MSVCFAIRKSCSASTSLSAPRVRASAIFDFASLAAAPFRDFAERSARSNAASAAFTRPIDIKSSPFKISSTTSFSSRILLASDSRSSMWTFDHFVRGRASSPVEAPSNASLSNATTLPLTRLPSRVRNLTCTGFLSSRRASAGFGSSLVEAAFALASCAADCEVTTAAAACAHKENPAVKASVDAARTCRAGRISIPTDYPRTRCE